MSSGQVRRIGAISIAVAGIAMLCVASPAAGAESAASRATCDGKPVRFHITRAKEILDHAYRHARWDEARIATRKENRRWRSHRDCLQAKEDRDRISAYRDAAEKSRNAWRERQERKFRQRYTPYDCGRHGFFAIPCSIVECESRFDFKARNSSSTAGGAYQIIASTWYRNGGKRYDTDYPAAVASPREQHVVGRRVWEREGRGSWQC